MGQADWEDLRLFSTVARAGSFSAAARATGLDASTVSRRMQRLEDALGTALFQRSPGGVLLSQAGMRLHARVVDAAASLDLGIDEATRGDDGAGTVRIATSTDLGRALLVPLLADWQRQRPGLVLEFLIGPELVDLQQRDADLALRPVAPTTGDLRRAKVSEVTFETFASPSLLAQHGHRDLVRLPWIVETLQAPTSQIVPAVPPPGATVVLRSNDLSLTRTACRHGIGVALLPDVFGRLDGLVPLPTPWDAPTVSLWLVGGAAALQRPAVRAVWDYLREAIVAPTIEQRVEALRSRQPR